MPFEDTNQGGRCEKPQGQHDFGAFSFCGELKMSYLCSGLAVKNTKLNA